MPFRTFTWQNGAVVLGDSTPDPELRQIDEDAFVILKSFCYRAARGDPDEDVVYLVPGEDFELPPDADLDPGSPPAVVVPPDTGGRTDLASVPSLFWWRDRPRLARRRRRVPRCVPARDTER